MVTHFIAPYSPSYPLSPTPCNTIFNDQWIIKEIRKEIEKFQESKEN
jgi:hypothetical protein